MWLNRVLRDLRFVSETYGLVIPASMSRRALADLAILISLWACADRGVNGMFGSPGADARPSQSPKIWIVCVMVLGEQQRDGCWSQPRVAGVSRFGVCL